MPTNKKAKIENFMLALDNFPVVEQSSYFKLALEEMGKYRLGIVCLTSDDGKLVGIMTDGDIRRRLLKDQRPLSALFVDDAIEHAIKQPITALQKDTLEYAIDLMEEKQVWDLPVVNSHGKLVGLLHLHAAIKYLLTETK